MNKFISFIAIMLMFSVSTANASSCTDPNSVLCQQFSLDKSNTTPHTPPVVNHHFHHHHHSHHFHHHGK